MITYDDGYHWLLRDHGRLAVRRADAGPEAPPQSLQRALIAAEPARPGTALAIPAAARSPLNIAVLFRLILWFN